MLGDGDPVYVMVDVDLIGQGHGHPQCDRYQEHGKQVGLAPFKRIHHETHPKHADRYGHLEKFKVPLPQSILKNSISGISHGTFDFPRYIFYNTHQPKSTIPNRVFTGLRDLLPSLGLAIHSHQPGPGCSGIWRSNSASKGRLRTIGAQLGKRTQWPSCHSRPHMVASEVINRVDDTVGRVLWKIVPDRDARPLLRPVSVRNRVRLC